MSWSGRISGIVILTLSALWSSAQIPVPHTISSNLRQKVFRVGADSLKIDTISIVPNSFFIQGIPATEFRLDFVKAILYWKKKPSADSVIIIYRVFPFQLNAALQRMHYDSVMNNFYIKPYEFYNGVSADQRNIFDFGTLKA